MERSASYGRGVKLSVSVLHWQIGTAPIRHYGEYASIPAFVKDADIICLTLQNLHNRCGSGGRLIYFYTELRHKLVIF